MYKNAGNISVAGDISLYLQTPPRSQQTGSVLSGGGFKFAYDRTDRPLNHSSAPEMTKDPQMLKYLMKHPKLDYTSPEFLRLKADFYRRKGFRPEEDQAAINAARNIGKMCARWYKITTYIDHYLNTITYHYVNGKLYNVTETGYIFQHREKLEKEIAGDLPQSIDSFFDEMNNAINNKQKQVTAQLNSSYRLNILKELCNTSKIDDYEQFCKELLSSGKFSGMKARKLSELLGNSELRSAYRELVNANNKLITMAERLEVLNMAQNKLSKFLNNTFGLLERRNLEKERDGLVRNCLLFATKFRNNVNDWAKRNPEYADVAEFVMDGIGYTVAIVGTIATASTIVASAEVSISVALTSGAIVLAKKYGFKQGEQKLMELSGKYGFNSKEAQEFRETTAWVIGKAKNLIDLIKFGKTVTKSDPFGDIAHGANSLYRLNQFYRISKQIKNNSKAYVNQKRSQMLYEVLSEFSK